MSHSTEVRIDVPEVGEQAIEVWGSSARVRRGGHGPALLLIHGGWGSATGHWEPVLSPLAESFEVIAPDLPGFGDERGASVRSVDDYADWLVALLDALGVRTAACVGNSFGASVAWSLACRHPDRCDALVLVNGFPMPRTPRILRMLGRLAPARALLGRFVRSSAFRPEALSAAFFDAVNVPESLRRMVAEAQPRSLDVMVDAFVLGGSTSAPPRAPTLVLWGADDRLRQSRVGTAVKLHRSIPGSALVLIARAGHLPQRERPDAFVAALREFLKVHPGR